MLESLNLKDKVCVVTGGYGHLGKAMVDGLLEMGAIVVVAGRNKTKFENVFRDRNEKLIFQEVDIMDPKSIKNAIEQINGNHNRIDVLINNAHAAKGGGSHFVSDEDWSYTLDGVLGSIEKAIKAVWPIMKNQGFGKIINIASMYGHLSPNMSLYQGADCEKYTNPPNYGAAKAGVIQLTKYYATIGGKLGIYVNAVSPGPFPSENVQNENKEFIERLSERNPLKTIGEPEDIQGTIVLLASDASNFITGQNICVDGGWGIW